MAQIWDDFIKAKGSNGVVMTLRKRSFGFEKWDAGLNDWTPAGWNSDFGGGATRVAAWSEVRGVTEKLLAGEA